MADHPARPGLQRTDRPHPAEPLVDSAPPAHVPRPAAPTPAERSETTTPAPPPATRGPRSIRAPASTPATPPAISEPLVPLSVNVPKELRRRLKAMSVRDDRRMQDLAIEALSAYLESNGA